MALTDPNLGLTYGWDFRESGWKDGMDDNLKALGAVVHLSILSSTTTAPPGSPTNGDRYIIPAGATGDWSGKTGEVAVRVGGAWEYYTPTEGWHAWVVSLSASLVYTSAAWILPGAASGTSDKPARIGALRLWRHGDGRLMKKDGSDPSDDDDGVKFSEEALP